MAEKLKESKDSIRCCYKITDTDVECLFKLLEVGKPVTSEDLAEMLNVSKTTVENSLKKLIDVGLVERSKGDEKKIGRPRYYYVLVDNVYEKIRKDLSECAKRIQASSASL